MPTKILTNLNKPQGHLWTKCKQTKVKQNQSWHIIQAALLWGQIYGERCCSTWKCPRSEAACIWEYPRPAQVQICPSTGTPVHKVSLGQSPPYSSVTSYLPLYRVLTTEGIGFLSDFIIMTNYSFQDGVRFVYYYIVFVNVGFVPVILLDWCLFNSG